jgi:hypothetical protein
MTAGSGYVVSFVADMVNSETSGAFGDLAVGAAYETGAQRDNGDGTFTRVTFSFWVESNPDSGDGFYVAERVETLTFTDVDDPGGSEVDSDYVYGDGSYLFYASLDDAEREARRLAEYTAATSV